MRLAETVTFGGGDLDRAATLRSQPERLAEALAGGLVLPLWRGRVLVDADAGGLALLPPDASLLRGRVPELFLGLVAGRGCFAADLSDWAPAGPAVTTGGMFDSGRQGHPDLPDHIAFEDLRGRMADLTPTEAELAATARGLLHWHSTHGFCAACGAASTLAQGGWQRECPSCGATHFPRTDPVVIMLVTRGNSVLLGRSPGWPEGMFSLLAGFMEPGETMEAAVRREVAEEAGVQVGAVRYLSSQPWPFPASLMLGTHAEALSDSITLDPAELEAARWVSREDLVEVFAGRHPDIRPGRKGAIARFLMLNWLADRLD
ncbi:NAD(+) diphosphatase [Paracoccaceae bacterium]